MCHLFEKNVSVFLDLFYFRLVKQIKTKTTFLLNGTLVFLQFLALLLMRCLHFNRCCGTGAGQDTNFLPEPPKTGSVSRTYYFFLYLVFSLK
jgi:hypothetical protein